MPRPSRNIDQLLIDTGRALLPETGARDFSIRQLTERAGVNLGMFHYHFKTRENFLSIVLQGVYEEMFAQLTFQAHVERPPLENLRAAVTVLGRFLRDNRHLLRRLVPDAMAGEPIAQGRRDVGERGVQDQVQREAGLRRAVSVTTWVPPHPRVDTRGSPGLSLRSTARNRTPVES